MTSLSFSKLGFVMVEPGRVGVVHDGTMSTVKSTKTDASMGDCCRNIGSPFDCEGISPKGKDPHLSQRCLSYCIFNAAAWLVTQPDSFVTVTV